MIVIEIDALQPHNNNICNHIIVVRADGGQYSTLVAVSGVYLDQRKLLIKNLYLLSIQSLLPVGPKLFVLLCHGTAAAIDDATRPLSGESLFIASDFFPQVAALRPFTCFINI